MNGSGEGSILLVEDNPDNALFVREGLTLGGGRFSMVEVPTLAAALEHLAELTPTCVVADLGLPDAEGTEIVVAIHGAAPSVPVVVLTGRDDERRDGLEAIRAGAEDYLMKSQLSGDMFVRVLRHAIERRQVAEQLRTSQRLLHGAIAASGTGMAIVHLDGSALLINPAFEAMLGMQPDELLGHDLCEIALPAEQARTTADFRRVASGETESLREETTYRHRRGHQVPVSLELSLIRDGHGQPVQMFLQVQDITERKAAEITQARLAAIVENSPDAMYLQDTAGIIRTWSPGAAAQYGYAAEEIIGRNVALLVPEEREGGAAACSHRAAQRTKHLALCDATNGKERVGHRRVDQRRAGHRRRRGRRRGVRGLARHQQHEGRRAGAARERGPIPPHGRDRQRGGVAARAGKGPRRS